MTLASYASLPEKSRGRIFKEEYDSQLSPFLKDKDRIIHSSAFRRLEYKTQVFVNHAGDHYRTRLTHTLEVTQIARIISRELGLNEDLAEVLALCHDLGHPPFGHAGEDGLNEAAKDYGGFDHNIQTIKVITSLEQRYAQFDGLNLTWETLEGAIKHNGPLIKNKSEYQKLPPLIKELNTQIDLQLHLYPSIEAQVASLADDIAYNSHDIDDGIRAAIIDLEDLTFIPIIKKIYMQIKKLYPDVSMSRKVNEVTRRLSKMMLRDLVEHTKNNLRKYKIKSVEDVRNLGNPIVAFSDEVEDLRKNLNKFLVKTVYRHYTVNRMTIKSKSLIKEIFIMLLNHPECLPIEWSKRIKSSKKHSISEIVIDYIAGMTDRYAIEEHKKLFNPEYIEL
jgi:dGTPase